MSNTIQLLGQSYNVQYHYNDLTTISELQSYFTIADLNRYSQLKEDIEKNGINDPILYYVTANGIKLVLDGHVRLKACIELKITDIPTKEIKEDFEIISDIHFWMFKNQCQRRNLTPIERLQLACLYEEAIEKRAKENLAKAGRGENIYDKVDTMLEIAKLADVSKATVARYRKVLKEGSEKLRARMIKGDVSITSAYMQTQNSRKKKSINPDTKTDIQEDVQQEPELESSQTEIFAEKYANDINTGRHLLVNNEIEYFIVAKDENKVKDFISQQPDVKYKVFILEL
ncbi:ParB/RepB/Spo0J family partition protein [Chryseobacterium bernardetii]|uniref:ParB/RepB/Spo0J family partition protein n=1 Tax=Chryseobacterium bernardetii TaxID=1241978 RepID=UPI003AF6D44B